MAIKYRSVRNGKIVTVPEPKEAEAAASNRNAGRKAAAHQRRTIQRMDDSRRWERADPEPAKTEPEPTPESQNDDAANDEPKPDGVHNVGGGWHEIVVEGEVVDKIRGAEAAAEAYEARTKW